MSKSQEEKVKTASSLSFFFSLIETSFLSVLFPVMKHRLSRAKNYLHFLMEYCIVYWNTRRQPHNTAHDSKLKGNESLEA